MGSPGLSAGWSTASGDSASAGEALHPALAEIAEEILALQRRQRLSAIDIPTDDRAAGLMIVRHGRQRESGRVAVAVLAIRPFHHAPAVVDAPSPAVGRAGAVDLLPVGPADLPDIQVTVRAIEAEAPGIPQAIAPDLGPCARRAHERIVRGYRVTRARGHVDPKHRSVQVRERLGASLVVAVIGPAVAQTDVEHAVGAERHLAPVVDVARLLHAQDRGLGGRVGAVGVGRHMEQQDLGVALEVAEMHHEATAGGVVGEEGEAEKPLLRFLRDPAGEIEKGLGEHFTVLNDSDRSRTLEHEEPGIAPRRGETDGELQTARDRARDQPHPAAGAGAVVVAEAARWRTP